MNDILLRSLTGGIFVATVIFSIWYGPYTTVGLFTVLLALSLMEFYRFFKKHEIISVRWYFPTVINLVIYGLTVGFMLELLPLPFIALTFPLLFILMLTELWRKQKHPMLNLGIHSLASLYLVVPFAVMSQLSFISDDEQPLLVCMFLLIWTNDTFAYLSGRFLGRTKLFERISPKKTWEGTIGGAVFTIALAWITGTYIDPQSGIGFWIPAALIIAPCAILGDLLESLFKRSLQVKDSGKIMPGHGGILDRFDAALFTAPFFLCWWLFYVYF